MSAEPSSTRGPGQTTRDTNKRAQALTKAYTDLVPLSKFPAVMKIVIKAINSGRYDDGVIRDALVRLAAENRAVTVDTLRYELDGFPAARTAPRRPNADDTIRDLLAPTGTGDGATILQLTRGEP